MSHRARILLSKFFESPPHLVTDSSCSIVIVHGLQGHPYKTWASKVSHKGIPTTPISNTNAPDDGSTSYHRVVPRFSGQSSGSPRIGVNSNQKINGMLKDDVNVKEAQLFWPKDLLPLQYPKARILLYGYDTKVTKYGSGPTNENSIHSHGKDLLSSLATFRMLDSPLILIAHSLGGIVVKEMLASSSNSTEDRLRNVVASTSAVIFLGTPHRGSRDLATFGDRARSIINAFRMKTNPAILDALRLKTKDLERAQEAFSAVWSQYDFRVKTFQEGLGLTGLNFGPFGKKVVPDYSSLLGDLRERAETMQANHMEMCRFTGPDDSNYVRLCGEITSVYNWLAGLNSWTPYHVDKRSLTEHALTMSSQERRGELMTERRNTCLQSLLFPNMNQRTQNFENPAEGTCSWFFKHEAFVNWITHKNQTTLCGLLWLRGKPGSGKSTLLKEALSRTTVEMSGSDCHVASFFFNAKGGDLEHSHAGMLRSIAYQMCSQNPNLLGKLLDFAQRRRALRGEDMAPWEEAELRAFVRSAIMDEKKRTIIFIDAIDECDPAAMRDVADFWRETTKMAHRVGVELSVCLSSRHFPAIAVSDCPEIIMENHNHADIVEFVRRRLDLGMTGDHVGQQAIQTRILEKSGGVFLWVSLVVKDILRKNDEGKGLRFLLKHLDSVPRELEDLFCQLLTAETFPTMVTRMFQWALLSTKPLRLHEWHHILAFISDTPPSSLYQWRQSDAYTESDEQLEKRITHLSRGLLGFNIRSGDDNRYEPADDSVSGRAGAGSLDLSIGETRVVQVIHESVRQYFMEGPGFAVLNPASAGRPLAHAHLYIMNVCLDYILIEELDALIEARKQAKLERSTKEPPALARAASVASFGSASSHDGRRTPVEQDSDHKESRIEDTLSEHKKRSRLNGSFSSIAPSRQLRERLYSLQTLKESLDSAGVHDVASSWLKDQAVTDQNPHDEPIVHACPPPPSVTGRTQVLEDHPSLLSYATFEIFTHALKADEEGLDPSEIIQHFWRNDTWRRLKALREDIDEQTELLYFAADLGLSTWLKFSFSWNGPEIMSSIQLAIGNDNAEALSRLLDAFPLAGYAKDVSSRMIASLASASSTALLQAYLSRHPSQRQSPRSPIMAIEDTLASQYEEGRTILHLVVMQQNKAAILVLLKHGADVSAVDRRLRTPLHLACMNQSRRTDNLTSDGFLAPRSDIVEMLLDHGADIDAADEEGRTPLMVACSNRVLPSQQDTDGDLASTEVYSGGGSFDVVEALLKRGADALKRDHMSFLPLHEACWNNAGGCQSKVIIASKLLDYGSPVNAAGYGCMTPLSAACYSSDVETIKELLRRGADPSLPDYNGNSPLHIAAARSMEQVVEILLSFPGTSVDATNNSGSTPLHMACDSHTINDEVKPLRLRIIRRLLEAGTEAYTIQNRHEQSPFDVARALDFQEALALLPKQSCHAPVRCP